MRIAIETSNGIQKSVGIGARIKTMTLNRIECQNQYFFFKIKLLAICPMCRQKISSMAGVAKQEDEIDNQRVSDGEVEKDVFREEKESGHEENDPEKPCVFADDTSPLKQEMDEKALAKSSWLEEPLSEDQQSTESHFLYFIFPGCILN